jgi:hypothetical protein
VNSKDDHGETEQNFKEILPYDISEGRKRAYSADDVYLAPVKEK